MALERIASRLGRDDEEPNIALAESLAEAGDATGIAEIAAGLDDPDDAVASDCIKVLYEIGERKPELIAPYAAAFLRLVKGRNQRRLWGGMTALARVAELRPREIWVERAAVLAAFSGKSVIAADQAVSVLAGLCRADDSYRADLFPELIDHLRICRPKEIAQHAERTAVCVGPAEFAVFKDVLADREADASPSQKARIEKLLRRLEKRV